MLGEDVRLRFNHKEKWLCLALGVEKERCKALQRIIEMEISDLQRGVKETVSEALEEVWNDPELTLNEKIYITLRLGIEIGIEIGSRCSSCGIVMVFPMDVPPGPVWSTGVSDARRTDSGS